MILIIGAGLSGLITAYRLKQQAIPFKILEARTRIGGRIFTTYGNDDCPTEMGATWFNSAHNDLRQLLDELDIGYFEQNMQGTAFYQPNPNSPAQSIEIPPQQPSYRISGGTTALTNALFSKLNVEDVLLNQTVTKIEFRENSVQVTAEQIFTSSHVVLALPPKLWSKRIQFEPNLPSELLSTAVETHTWMEDSIKIALRFDKPFWKEHGQSGAFFSNSGPITEFYDHSNHQQTQYALCGFMSSSYKNLAKDDRKQKVLNQLQNVFGDDVLNYLDYQECIWSREQYTFESSETLLFPHQNNGHPIFRKNYFSNRLFISSAESAQQHPGYMDGAVTSGNSVAEKISQIFANSL